jgi:hypothetical protein
MDDLDRPNLGLDVVEQIEVDLHHQDMRFWPLLKQLQLPTPETQKAYAPFVFNEGPMPPRRPRKLSELLGSYAVASFQCEASKYPRLDPQFAHWLQRLAERIEERTIQRVEQVEAGSSTNSLAYHGLSTKDMRVAIKASLVDAIRTWPQASELSLAATESNTSHLPPAEPEPATTENETSQDGNTVGSEVARRRALLAEYKAVNGDVSNRQIYQAQNSGLHKPQFYQWKSGKLAASTATATNFERFLKAKKPPIPRAKKA